MKTLKVHYSHKPYKDEERYEAVCEITNYKFVGKKLTKDWNKVTCKKCLSIKEWNEAHGFNINNI